MQQGKEHNEEDDLDAIIAEDDAVVQKSFKVPSLLLICYLKISVLPDTHNRS